MTVYCWVESSEVLVCSLLGVYLDWLHLDCSLAKATCAIDPSRLCALHCWFYFRIQSAVFMVQGLGLGFRVQALGCN